MERWYRLLTSGTEKILTWFALQGAKRFKKRKKKKNALLDWMDFIVWAALVILLVNQYLFLAFHVPSDSMNSTLGKNEHLLVNRFIYGPELVPGLVKLPGLRLPERFDVVIFENPAYHSPGGFKEILGRIVSMLSFSFIDTNKDQTSEKERIFALDSDEQKPPPTNYLIKRVVGYEGDRIRLRQGSVELKPKGSSKWIKEQEIYAYQKIGYPVLHSWQKSDYGLLKNLVQALVYKEYHLKLNGEQSAALQDYQVSHDHYLLPLGLYAFLRELYAFQYSMEPDNSRWRREVKTRDLGWYIQRGSRFLLGDNRDDSFDSRDFGTVAVQQLLGKAMIKFWPLDQWGPVN